MMTKILMSIISFLVFGGTGALSWFVFWIEYAEKKSGTMGDEQGAAVFTLFTTPIVGIICGILGIAAYLHWR